MPPEDKLKVDIDPIFKGNNGVLSKPQEETENKTGVYNALTNQEYTPNQPPINPVKITPPSPGKIAIRTYKDDIQEAIQANHLSSVNIAIAENDRMRQKMRGPESIETKSAEGSKIIPILITLVVIIAVGAMGYFGYSYYKKIPAKTQSVSTIAIPKPFFTVEYRNEFNIDRAAKDRQVSALASQINDTNIPLGNIYSIYLTTGTSTTKSVIKTSNFLSLLESNIPDQLSRNLDQNFMIGTFSFAQNIPFVILRTTNYEVAYAGMLEWEKILESDFGQLFRLNQNQNRGVATTTATLGLIRFQDDVVGNQDVRVLKDNDGKIFFIYGIVGKEYIIITANEMGFKEILTRINREKGLKR